MKIQWHTSANRIKIKNLILVSFFISRANSRLHLPFTSVWTWINTIFFKCMSVLNLFYHSFSCRSKTFSVHLIARFIAGCHFVAMCTCSARKDAFLHAFWYKPCYLKIRCRMHLFCYYPSHFCSYTSWSYPSLLFFAIFIALYTCYIHVYGFLWAIPTYIVYQHYDN